MHKKAKKKIKQRPAETGGVAGALALLVGKVAGIDDPTTLAAIGIVIGFVPAAITWVIVKVKS